MIRYSPTLLGVALLAAAIGRPGRASAQESAYPILEVGPSVSIVEEPSAPAGMLFAAPPAEIPPTPPPPPNPYTGDLLSRERLSGDWGGARSSLAEKGLTFDLFLTQFYQGVASGGREQEFEYGGKIDYLFKVDGGKLGLQEGLFIDMHAETRYGTSTNEIDGLFTPNNIAMTFPAPDQNISSITGLKITQALSENFAVFLGKINTLDEYPIQYSPLPGVGKPGLEGFMNTSLVFNPIVARTVPYSAAGVGAAYIKDGIPVFSVTAFDPEERATKGLQDLFARGVTVLPNLILMGKPFGKPGLLNLGGTYSNSTYRTLEPAAYLDILRQFLRGNPGAAATSPVESGSWSVFGNFYQSIWVDPCDEKRTWGFFGQFGISDGNPNPVRYVANGGIGGRSMISGRDLDTFGVGYFYLGLSDEFKAITRPLLPQRDEYGVEFFYNYAITPAARFTADLQIARPSTVGFDTAIIPGFRLQLLF